MEENGSTAPVDGFEAVPEGTLDGTQEVQADNSDGVFDWKEWEQTADGFKLRKKKSAVSAAAEAQNVLVLMRFRLLMKSRRMAKQQVRKV